MKNHFSFEQQGILKQLLFYAHAKLSILIHRTYLAKALEVDYNFFFHSSMTSKNLRFFTKILISPKMNLGKNDKESEALYYESDAFRVAKFNFPPIHVDLGLASIWWKIENKKFIILMTHQNFCKVNRLEDNRRKLSFIWALQCRFKLEKARFVCLFVIKYAWKGIKKLNFDRFLLNEYNELRETIPTIRFCSVFPSGNV